MAVSFWTLRNHACTHAAMLRKNRVSQNTANYMFFFFNFNGMLTSRYTYLSLDIYYRSIAASQHRVLVV